MNQEKINNTFHCNKHNLNYEGQPIVFMGKAIQPPCPECSKELENSETPENEIKNYNSNKIFNDYEKMRIRPEFYDKTLDNFNAETESQKQALNACKDLIDGKINKIILMGSNGIGKSHLGNSVLKIMGGKRYTAYELSCLYRQCYSVKAVRSELELINDLANEPFLLIDEVGRTKGSEAEQNFFSQLLDERHTRHKPFMIITNKIRKAECPAYKLNKLAACQNCSRNCIECFLDNDILSRLSEKSAKITIIGRDYRKAGMND